MNLKHTHKFNVTFPEAKRIQENLRKKVKTSGRLGKVKTVAGADVAFSKDEKMFYAAVLVFDYPEFELLEVASSKRKAEFPYVPGYLTFREGPALLDCFRKLKRRPDVVLFDGQGIAHPRKMGEAAHLGVLVDLPSVGCAKSLLVGEYGRLGKKRGAEKPIVYKGEKLGVALRTRAGVKPIFVSVGHKVSLDEASRFVLNCARKYRLPEPTREAHIFVGKMRKGAA